MQAIWKNICSSIFRLTKRVYSIQIKTVLAYFTAQAAGITSSGSTGYAENNQHIFKVIAPLTGAAVLIASFGISALPGSGMHVYAGETQSVYGQPYEVVNRVMEENTDGSLVLQSRMITAVAPVESAKTTVSATEHLAAKSTSAYKEAAGLYLNGDFIGAAANGEDLTIMLQDLLSNNTPEDCKEIAFTDQIEIKTDLYAMAAITSAEAIKAQLTGLSAKPMGYTVTETDSWESIAETFGCTVNELKVLNPNIAAPLKSGDKLSVIAKKSILSIAFTKEESYEQTIPFETQVEKDSSQYTTYSEVLTEGMNGTNLLVDAVTYVNGKETARTNVSQTVTQEPVTKVVAQGTKTPPAGSVPGVSSGTLTWPVPTIHVISSGFGYRGGVRHSGIDIANGAAYGHTFVAADAGTVEFAGYDNSGYGLYIIVNHGNGRKTLYGHASKALVQAGTKVTKGQAIGLIGNTGYSDGAHLHFEVIENGVSVNPLNYVRA